jgi:flagellar basal body-associated protein FliL
MRLKIKNSIGITIILILLFVALAISVWLFFYKGTQQNKTYSGAKLVYYESVENLI